MANIKTLKRIISLRERKKEEKELEVKKAFQELQLEEEKLKNFNEAYDGCLCRLGEVGLGRMRNHNELLFIYDYMNYLNLKINSQHKIVEDKTFVLDQKRYELTEAYKEVKTVEKLMNRIVTEEQRQEVTKAQKEMDFLFLSRMGR
ncbi:MAG: flagellar export protein FliJ [Candidatus Magnetoovum sp. WYHC-5]|nr:flagellar export protein FliJ [Candidatus Magnetoovum sp. WYHC-5]